MTGNAPGNESNEPREETVSNRQEDATAYSTHVLETTDPDADLKDLEPLRDSLADRRLVGLGEATHGTREFFRLKHRLVRFLVEELGFRAFAMEANFAETRALDRYVRHGTGDARTALSELDFWIWQTEGVLDLVEWLRAFNADRPPRDRVGFYGFDAQFTGGAANALVDYLERVDPEYLATIRTELEGLSDPGLRPWPPEEDCDELTVVERLVPELRTRLEDYREAYVSRASESEWEFASQCVTVFEQVGELAEAWLAAGEDGSEETLRVRDRVMATNVEWLLDTLSTDGVVLWAHNDHVNRTKTTSDGRRAPSMGHHLDREFGEDYYALGFEFNGGAFQALVETDEGGYERRECRLETPVEDTLAETIDEDHSLAFLDLERDEGGWECGLHSTGATFDPARANEYVDSYDLTEAFDGVIYVKETTRARPLDHG